VVMQVNEDPKDLSMSARAAKPVTVMHELLRPCHNLRALSDTKHVNRASALAQRLGPTISEERESRNREIKSHREPGAEGGRKISGVKRNGFVSGNPIVH
jgi:hypothetical protein